MCRKQGHCIAYNEDGVMKGVALILPPRIMGQVKEPFPSLAPQRAAHLPCIICRPRGISVTSAKGPCTFRPSFGGQDV
jgi:hypothetical protein